MMDKGRRLERNAARALITEDRRLPSVTRMSILEILGDPILEVGNVFLGDAT